mmetsp:Transcript_18223/g.25922  ORF Transcript_18223/g.25922 Transcript_18223/m.25922 type:complete len:213 (+) Transcript_18223:108-746(+)|eukprot:CAMPEP_0172423320 /NCGR_PEP_ID=MMETSP1064-20121228/15241_1 /TAXON_ID=202472 /ORGANISM="Aulacoseira subarctica , Strain CCAP 1002/5" /LENGTH=212 /DNA_ID=CAMNT_0013164629 /DNA_START=79 /DNA_END=717 /DNA_ORIENTATION=-
MKVAIITSVLISGVSSFAPSVRTGSATSTQLRMADYENALGAQKPLGFWDPLDMVTNKPQEVFDDLRLKEIKHGRAAMLAVVGNLYTLSGARLPGGLGSGDEVLPFNEIPAGIDALKTVPQAGLLQIIAFIGFLDVVVMQDKKGKAEFPGDLRNGFDFGWSKFTEEEKLQKRAIELNNGRAAQMGILALVVHNYLGNLDLIIPDPHYYVGSV